MYEERLFTTPRGNSARLLVRPGTNDAMMSESAILGDEYRLKEIELVAGDVVLDIGAHIGMVAVAIALDFPEAKVVALEPVPENFDLLVENLRENGLLGRVEPIHGAASRPNAIGVEIAYDFEGGELETIHRFVGNQPMPPGTPQKTVTVDAYGLPDLVKRRGKSVRLIVIDAEGAEYDVLRGASLSLVEEIRGEYHAGFAKLAKQLSATHDVERRSGDDTFGSFVARLRR